MQRDQWRMERSVAAIQANLLALARQQIRQGRSESLHVALLEAAQDGQPDEVWINKPIEESNPMLELPQG
jgi:hypothetical protein